jgi:Tol biopolymer transport system component
VLGVPEAGDDLSAGGGDDRALGVLLADGEWIVHATNGVGGNADLFIMRADGTDPRPLTRTKLSGSAPDWGA